MMESSMIPEYNTVPFLLIESMSGPPDGDNAPTYYGFPEGTIIDEGIESESGLSLFHSCPNPEVAGEMLHFMSYFDNEAVLLCTIRLVGIETNPGPGAAGGPSKRKKKGKAKSARKRQIQPRRGATNRNMAGIVRKDQSAAASSGSSSSGSSNSFLGNLGGSLGGAFFGKTGESIGSTAGNFVSKIFGWGAYTVNKNTLMGNCDGTPSFGTIGDGHVITHKEFLTDVVGSTTFTLTEYDIQPGRFQTFPWLSALTVNYEQYELMGLIFEYKSTSAYSVSSTNTALGTVIMATNYDSYDSNFTSKQQMEAYEFSTSCAPYENMIHPVECAPRLNVLSNMYLRSGLVPSGADQRFYDMGKFQIATTGMQSGVTTIGELWVSYMIRLLKPKLPTPLGAGLLGAHIVEGAINTASATNAFGSTAGVIRAGSLLPVAPTNTTFTLPYSGQYLISACWVSSAGNITAVAAPGAGSNITAQTILNDNGNFNISSFTTSTTVYMFVVSVSKDGGGTPNQISWTGPVGMTAGTCDIFIQQISAAILITKSSLEERLASLEEFIQKSNPRQSENASSSSSSDEWITVKRSACMPLDLKLGVA